MERFLATVVFCEAPLDGTLVLPAGDGVYASGPEKRGDDDDAVAAGKGAAKHCSYTYSQPQQQQRAGAVDGLAIFEAVVLQ